MKMPTFTPENCPMVASHPACLRKNRECMCGFNPQPKPEEELEEIDDSMVEEVSPAAPSGRMSTGERDLRSKTDREAS